MAIEDVAGLRLEGLEHRPGLGLDPGGVDCEEPPRQRPKGDGDHLTGLVVSGDLNQHLAGAGPGDLVELPGLGPGVDAQRLAEGGEGHRAVALLVDGAGGGQDEPAPKRDAGQGEGRRMSGGVRVGRLTARKGRATRIHNVPRFGSSMGLGFEGQERSGSSRPFRPLGVWLCSATGALFLGDARGSPRFFGQCFRGLLDEHPDHRRGVDLVVSGQLFKAVAVAIIDANVKHLRFHAHRDGSRLSYFGVALHR